MPVAERIERCLLPRLEVEQTSSESPAEFDLGGDGVVQPVPPHVIQAAKDALDAGETHYTSRTGVPALRAAVAADVTARHGLDLGADDVVITSGGLEATFAALWIGLATEPGARFVCADPNSPAIAQLACLAGAEVRRISTTAEDGFLVRADAVRAAIAGGARMLMLSSPDAVTGVSLPVDDLAGIADLAEEHDLIVVLNEAGARCTYPGRQPTSLRGAPSLANRTVIVGSFSHDYRLAGWRVGYFAARGEVFARMRSLKVALSICSTAVSQFAALAAIVGPQDWIEGQRAEFARRRAAFTASLEQVSVRVVPADAFPFVWVDVRPLGVDAAEATSRLAAVGIQARAGGEFGPAGAGCLRFTLALPPDRLAAACARVATALAERAQ
jgi:aminotransferase